MSQTYLQRQIPKYLSNYISEIKSKNIDVPVTVRKEINRILKRVDDSKYYYSPEPVEHFINFCENELCLTDGSDFKMLLTFKVWAESFMCWYTYENGLYERLITSQYLIVARGAAKSFYSSLVLAYYCFLSKDTKSMIITAPTVRQSLEIYRPIQTFLSRKKGPFLQHIVKDKRRPLIFSSKTGIINDITGSEITIVPMSIDKLQGQKCKVACADEWLSTKTKESVFEAIEQGASKIASGGVTDYIIIGTSSEGTVRNGVGDEIKKHLDGILNGNQAGENYSIWHYKLDSVREVSDETKWVKANPNIGNTVSYKTYREAVSKMETTSAMKNDILSKRFGIPRTSDLYFFGWDEIQPSKEKINIDGMKCYVGGDFSKSDDFTAITFLCPYGDKFLVKTLSFCLLKKFESLHYDIQNRYKLFIKEKSLVVIDSELIDVIQVYKYVHKYIKEHKLDVVGLGYDPYGAKSFVHEWKQDYGINNTIPIRQGSKTESVPLGELKNLSLSSKLVFDQELMSYGMGNAIATIDNNGNYKLSKDRAIEKIDNVSALLDAYILYKEMKGKYGY